MDKKLGTNIIVGIFVFIGFLLFVFLLMNIGSGTGIFSKQFILYARFPHVKGLHYGSEVSLAGLRVGTVKDIRVANESEKKEIVVELAVSKSVQDKIREDSVARVVTQGVLGDKYIELTIGSPQFAEIKNNSIIKSEEVPDILSKSGNLLEGVSKQFNKGGEIDSLFAHLNELTVNLNAMVTEIRNSNGLYKELMQGKSGEKFSRSLGKIDSILAKIDSGEGTLGALVNDPSVYEDLKSLMGGAKRSNILRYFMKSFIEEGEKANKAQSSKKN